MAVSLRHLHVVDGTRAADDEGLSGRRAPVLAALLAVAALAGWAVGAGAGGTVGLVALGAVIVAATLGYAGVLDGVLPTAAEPASPAPVAAGPREVIAEEVARCRRFSHPCTLVRLGLDGPAASAASTAVVARLRRTDRAWIDRRGLLLMLPESSRDRSDALARRLVAEIPGLAQASIRLASFPEDGVTADALLAVAAGGAPPASRGDLPRLHDAELHGLTGQAGAEVIDLRPVGSVVDLAGARSRRDTPVS